MSRSKIPDALDSFRIALEFKRNSEGISQREVCRRAGVGQNTYSRLVSGKTVDVSTFDALCCWLGEPASTFLGPREPVNDTRYEVMTLIANDPEYRHLVDAVTAVIDIVSR